jgi:mono/diheme cytochrome c family protein
LEAIDKATLFTALKDADRQVRRAAVRISEPYIQKNDDEVIDKLAALVSDSSYDVQLQLLLSFYNNKGSKAQSLVQTLLEKNAANTVFSGAKNAMDKNSDILTYGTRLAGMPENFRKSILEGKATFSSLCVTCHGPEGKGMVVAGSAALPAPPLTGAAKRLGGERVNLIKILLHGLTGPVDGKTYPSVMPALGANSDEWVSSVVNYVRYEFGKVNYKRRASDTIPGFITPAEVKLVRNQTMGRNDPWTLKELEN